VIIGLTDDIQPRLTRLGKLRKGGDKTTNGFGPDLDHFRFTSDRPEIVTAFERAFGKAPRSVLVYTFAENTEQVFSTWCEIWDKSGLVHRCDGQTMSVWRNGDKYERGAKPCAGGHDKGYPRNDAVGRLEVVVPELIEAGFVGTVTMETHSLNDIISISSSLEYVRVQRKTLAGAAFNLRRVSENISVPGWGDRKGQRNRADKWLVKLDPVAEFALRQLAQVSEFLIEAPRQVDGETGEITPPSQVEGTHTAPKDAPDDGWTWTVESAGAILTPRGARLGTLTPEQLELLIERGHGKMQSAAVYLRAYLQVRETLPTLPTATAEAVTSAAAQTVRDEVDNAAPF
jgi:hypothetical protein